MCDSMIKYIQFDSVALYVHENVPRWFQGVIHFAI